MAFIDAAGLEAGEPRSGWHDRYFRSDSMSFAYYDVDEGAFIHAHAHPEEEVWHIIEGSLEITVAEETRVLTAGAAVVVPSNTSHSVQALADSRVIIANHPARQRVGRPSD